MFSKAYNSELCSSSKKIIVIIKIIKEMTKKKWKSCVNQEQVRENNNHPMKFLKNCTDFMQFNFNKVLIKPHMITSFEKSRANALKKKKK